VGATILTVALAAWLLTCLVVQAAAGFFYTDECFHAYAAEWIARHGRLPVVFPEFYSGLAYYYPPLLHLIGAGCLKLFGSGSLHQVNVALFGLLLVAVALPIVPGMAWTPRRWAVLLLVASHWLAVYAVRLYVEMLISLLAFVAIMLLERFHRTQRRRDAAWLGVVAGLALVTKHTAIVLPLGIAACAVGSAMARDRGRSHGYLVALAIALAIAIPFFVRNAVLYGSPFYPLFARDSNVEVWRLNVQAYSLAPLAFYRSALESFGAPVLGMTAAALALAAWRRRWTVATAVMLGGLAVLIVGGLTPLHDTRHTMPLVPLLALAASATVWAAVERQPRLQRIIEAGLLVIAAVIVVRIGYLRAGVDLPPPLEAAYAAIRERTPPEAKILSVWTYDTAYYTHCKATWPIPWSQRERSFELFYERDPDRFLAMLRQYHIDFVLLPSIRPPPVFNGMNYPRSFMDCVETLGKRGALRIVWRSKTLIFIGVNDDAPATP